MGDRSSAGWNCCHNPGQGEGLDNIHSMSKGMMKSASRGLWAVQACPSFLRNNVENKQTTKSEEFPSYEQSSVHGKKASVHLCML